MNRRIGLFCILLLIGGCATAGPKPSRQELALAEKQLNLSSADFFFDKTTAIREAAYKILSYLPENEAKGNSVVLPIVPVDIDFALQRIYSTGSLKGVMVAGIMSTEMGGPASVKRGDEIMELEGLAVHSEKDIRKTLERSAGLEKVRLKFRRGAKEWEESVPIIRLKRRYAFVIDGKALGIAARTDGQQFIYLSTGLLRLAQSEDELAFILARQIAYDTHGHVTHQFSITSQDPPLISLLRYFYYGYDKDSLTQYAPLTGINFGTSRKTETEGDKAAMDYMKRAGWDPKSALAFLEKVAVQNSEQPKGWNYAFKTPDAERLLKVRQAADSGEIVSQTKDALNSEIRKKRLDFFFDNTLEVTAIGYRLLEHMDHGADAAAVLPFLYVDVKSEYKSIYHTSQEKGVMVVGLLPGFGEEGLSFQRGDELIRINGEKIDSEKEAAKVLAKLKDKKHTTVTFLQNGREIDRQVLLLTIAKKIPFAVKKEDAAVNAYADIFGSITVTSGMLNFIRNQDELAFVLAHEIGHLMLGHVKKGITNNMLGAAAGMTLGSLVEAYVPGLGNATAQTASGIVVSPYSKELEKEADYAGLQYLVKAGYDGGKACKVWERFAVEIPKSRKKTIMDTHPTSPERFARMNAVIKEILGSAGTNAVSPASNKEEASGSFDHVRIDNNAKLGPIFESEADPKAIGILESGLAQEVKDYMVEVKLKGEGSIFPFNVKKIIWYAKLEPNRAFVSQFARNYRIRWYKPDGALFYEKRFGAGIVNESVTRSELAFKQPIDPAMLGRWRVRVWKGYKLVDDRYFLISPQSPPANG